MNKYTLDDLAVPPCSSGEHREDFGNFVFYPEKLLTILNSLNERLTKLEEPVTVISGGSGGMSEKDIFKEVVVKKEAVIKILNKQIQRVCDLGHFKFKSCCNYCCEMNTANIALRLALIEIQKL